MIFSKCWSTGFLQILYFTLFVIKTNVASTWCCVQRLIFGSYLLCAIIVSSTAAFLISIAPCRCKNSIKSKLKCMVVRLRNCPPGITVWPCWPTQMPGSRMFCQPQLSIFGTETITRVSALAIYHRKSLTCQPYSRLWVICNSRWTTSINGLSPSRLCKPVSRVPGTGLKAGLRKVVAEMPMQILKHKSGLWKLISCVYCFDGDFVLKFFMLGGACTSCYCGVYVVGDERKLQTLYWLSNK